MAAAPEVSVCLTTYNRATVLPATIDSILGQTFSDFELIISDDRSTDETEEVCRDYAQRDQRVVYRRNEENLKMPGNLNAAIAAARGELVANLHDGDVYRPDLLEQWRGALLRVPSAAFVFNDYEVFGRDGSRSIARMPFDGEVLGTEIARHFFETLTSCVWGTVMCRASVYREVRPFDERFGFISDVEMWIRLCRRWNAVYVPKPLLTIAPRESDHPYRFLTWRQVFWSLLIYVEHLDGYSDLLPREVDRWKNRYRSRRRRYIITGFLSLLKDRQYGRIREGFAMWRDADDPLLRAVGLLLGRPDRQPDWYDRRVWNQTSRPLAAADSSV